MAARSLVIDGAGKVVPDPGLEGALELGKRPETKVWVDLLAPTAEELATLGKLMGLHPLTLDDLVSPRVQPKVEEFEAFVYVVFKALDLETKDDLLDTTNVNFLLFDGLLVTAAREKVPAVAAARESLGRNCAPLLQGPAYVMYTVLDRLIDQYLSTMDDLEEALGFIETRIFEKFDRDVAQSIFQWRKTALALRRRTTPHREALMLLAECVHPVIPEASRVCFRDAFEHQIRVDERVTGFREHLQSCMDSFLAQEAREMNVIMKTLSIVATIVLPLNLLTGLYGTNFELLPGKQHPMGFWFFLGGMVGAALTVTLVLRARRWI